MRCLKQTKPKTNFNHLHHQGYQGFGRRLEHPEISAMSSQFHGELDKQVHYDEDWNGFE